MKKTTTLKTTLRQRLFDVYDFSDPASLELLDQLVLAVEQLHIIQERLGKDGVMVRGSTGQPRAHPLLAEQDRLRRSLLALTRSLRLTLDEVLHA